ncbi:MAG: DUF2975 domain-containing protein [Clostridia bacterium]|nr:DUF2975 domain-containing protein [Clostridia bacterium]
MAKMTSRGKIRLTSYIVFFLIAWITIHVLVEAIRGIAGFFAARETLGADFGQSLAFNAGISNLMSWSFFLAALVVMAVLFAAILENETPFTPKVPRRMKLTAILLLISGEGSYLVALLIYRIQLNKYALLQYDMDSLSTSLSAEGGSFLALIFLCLAYIFEHGLKLQQENDETL